MLPVSICAEASRDAPLAALLGKTTEGKEISKQLVVFPCKQNI